MVPHPWLSPVCNFPRKLLAACVVSGRKERRTIVNTCAHFTGAALHILSPFIFPAALGGRAALNMNSILQMGKVRYQESCPRWYKQ